MSKIIIGIIGGATASKAQLEAAYKVGSLLAKQQAVVVCGGMGGVMEAACRGAKENGGLTVGILPGSSAREGNRYLDIPIVTGLGYARNAVVVQTAQAIIAIGGKYGTLSELAYAAQYGIPLIGLSTWKVRLPMKHVQTPAEAVRLALQSARER